MKKCPYCAEEIQDAAIKCKHCGEFLNGAARVPTPAAGGLPWHFRISSIVLMLLCLPPFALPMIWWHPKMKPASKALWILVTLVLTWLMVITVVQLWHVMTQVVIPNFMVLRNQLQAF